jgi:FHS family L-fucose permease-like MFS transporter
MSRFDMPKYNKHALVGEGYLLSFVLITFFFFLWGFARAILDVLNPFFQETFEINKIQASLIQFVTYTAYFLTAIPAGLLINKQGTRKGVLTGLMAFGGAAIFFVFSSCWGSHIFWFYLFLLFVIGCGLACLEVAANPYVTLLGDPETAASRINRAQSFNGLGCICGSLSGGIYCFSSEDPNISFPYVLTGMIVLLVAALFSRVKLPEFVTADKQVQGKTAGEGKTLFRRPLFLFGLFALFCYEVAEIAINSFFINYAAENHMAEWTGHLIRQTFHIGMNPKFIASVVLSAGLFLFMCGRFLGSWMMRFVRAEKALLCCAAGTVVATALVVIDLRTVSFIASMLIFVFESIMFPTIFALSVRGLDSRLTQKASAVLMMTPVGGAVGTVCMGMAADYRDMTFSFLVPLVAFAVVLCYSGVLLFGQHRRHG